MNKVIALALLLSTSVAMQAKNYLLRSPNTKLEVTIVVEKELSYSLAHQSGVQLLAQSKISLELNDGTTLSSNPKVINEKRSSKTEEIVSHFYRYPSFNVSFNELNLKLKGDIGVVFRAYDEGVAYRFYSTRKQPFQVINEVADFNFDKDYLSYRAYSTTPQKPFEMAFQNLYTKAKLSEAPTDNLAFLPVTVDYGNGLKLTLLESDLEKYPGMFVRSQAGKKAFEATFATYPKSFKIHPHRYMKQVEHRDNFIAKVSGDAQFPWRVLAVTEKDTDMPTNNLVYALASPNRIGDVSWIKGGLSAWEWWNDWGISGVDFKAGINQQTYKHYIDFASENKIPFLILDEGWYEPKSGNMLEIIPELDLKELIEYGKAKNVGLILWTVFNVLDTQLEEACKLYAEMGIKGFKVDFMDRDDQEAVEMVYRLAEATARHKLTLDLHGIYKPTGLNRTYPNVINFESVFGMEEVKWSKIEKDMMEYDVTMPFIRMMCGPLDYTPGAMRNANKKDFRDVYYEPMSQGTRCHQLATYIVHDSPLTMLADDPTAYRREKECTNFIASIPNCDIEETKVLQGALGEFIVSARKVNGNWYVGGLTNWTPRKIAIDLSFLADGEYLATVFCDGMNAPKLASDYTVNKSIVSNKSELVIEMAPGGGCAISLIKQ